MATDQEIAAMRRALGLATSPDAARGPNPRVGAVILDGSGNVVGEGYHCGAGTPHAEVVALERAGEAARGGVAVVTLEPCQHTGRTGPCTAALVDAGVARVVFAQSDTNPIAAGGAAYLRAAGIDVEAGVMCEAALDVNPEWTLAVNEQRPFVTWKFAASLDGRVAAKDGSSQWITGDAARADVQRLRATVDAIMVGTGTALRDDPRLTVRDPKLGSASPLRVVVGQRALPERAKVLDDSAPTLLISSRDPVAVTDQLFAHGVRHVLLEGGPTLAGAFVEAKLVDRVVAYLAPVLLGDGPNALSGSGVETIADAHRLNPESVEQVGSDLRIIATLRTASTGGLTPASAGSSKLMQQPRKGT